MLLDEFVIVHGYITTFARAEFEIVPVGIRRFIEDGLDGRSESDGVSPVRTVFLAWEAGAYYFSLKGFSGCGVGFGVDLDRASYSWCQDSINSRVGLIWRID
jgi:hypothetical protein